MNIKNNNLATNLSNYYRSAIPLPMAYSDFVWGNHNHLPAVNKYELILFS